MVAVSPQLSCAGRADLLTAIFLRAGVVMTAATAVAILLVHPQPMGRQDRPLRPVLAWARPTMCERGPPTKTRSVV